MRSVRSGAWLGNGEVGSKRALEKVKASGLGDWMYDGSIHWNRSNRRRNRFGDLADGGCCVTWSMSLEHVLVRGLHTCV